MTYEALLSDYCALKEQFAIVNSSLALLSSEKQELLAETQQQRQELEQAKEKEQYLNSIISNLKWRLFGPKSERRAEAAEKAGQMYLFELEARESTVEKELPIKEHSRKVRKRFELEEEEAAEGTFPAHLPRKDELIDEKPEGVADENLEKLPPKITERLGSTPQVCYVRRIIRNQYKIKDTGEIVTPRAPGHVLDRRCKVDETFLVLMVIQKYLWHLPIYRQHQQLKLQGIKLSRDRMVCWTIEFAGLLKGIVEELKTMIRGSPVVHCDEAPVLVGKKGKDGDKRYSEGRFWPVLAEEIGVAFAYTPTRSKQAGYQVLSGIAGVLVSDAYDVYESFVSTTSASWQLCWMHTRRNFIEAEASNRELAGEALEYIRRLYQIEASIKHESAEHRSLRRQCESKAVLEEFRSWMDKKSATAEVLTDNLMSKAMSYVLSRWDAACFFVYDEAVPIDNGAAERALRPSRLGIKNWLHCASEGGAEAAAIYYSLIGSALMNGIHPYYYLLDLTKRLDDSQLKARDLVPHLWKKRFYEEAVPKEMRNLIATGAPFVGDADKALAQSASMES